MQKKVLIMLAIVLFTFFIKLSLIKMLWNGLITKLFPTLKLPAITYQQAFYLTMFVSILFTNNCCNVITHEKNLPMDDQQELQAKAPHEEVQKK